MSGNRACPVAIITGGSGGLAPGIARILGQQGYDLVLAARDAEKLQEAAEALRRSTQARIEIVPCDVTRTASVSAMTMTVTDRLGRIDLLVNAAASSTPIGGAIERLDVGALIADFDTKVGGYLRCIQAVSPVMKRQGEGRIVNVGGLTGRSSDALSGMRNAAISHLTKVMADQLGPHGITVNAVHPGLTLTPHLIELFGEMAGARGATPEAVEAEFISQVPIRRFSTPDEIGDAIAFLADRRGASINGESISIDGGYSRGIYL